MCFHGFGQGCRADSWPRELENSLTSIDSDGKLVAKVERLRTRMRGIIILNLNMSFVFSSRIQLGRFQMLGALHLCLWFSQENRKRRFDLSNANMSSFCFRKNMIQSLLVDDSKMNNLIPIHSERPLGALGTRIFLLPTARKASRPPKPPSSKPLLLQSFCLQVRTR